MTLLAAISAASGTVKAVLSLAAMLGVVVGVFMMVCPKNPPPSNP